MIQSLLYAWYLNRGELTLFQKNIQRSNIMQTCYNCFKEKPANEETCSHCGYTNSGEIDEHYYLPQGTILHDRYTIGRILGHGGFGITYVGHDNKLDILVAIKEYLPTDVASRAIGETTVTTFSGEKKEQYDYGLVRFLDEAKTLARYNQHPCIVSTTDYFESNNTAYLVMEYLDGISLNEYLKRKGGKITWHTTYEIMMPVIDALREVHKSGMIHRDVSPDNIYITKTGQVKLLDFGAARFAFSEKSKSLSVVLKPGYAPPEQYSTKGKQGPWTDVYAVAATMYRMLTGSTPPEAVDRVMSDDMIGLIAQEVEIDSQVESAILQALAVNGADRQESIEALREGLIIKVKEEPSADMIKIEPIAYHGDIDQSKSVQEVDTAGNNAVILSKNTHNKYFVMMAVSLLFLGLVFSISNDVWIMVRYRREPMFMIDRLPMISGYVFLSVLFLSDYLGLTSFSKMNHLQKILSFATIGILVLRLVLPFLDFEWAYYFSMGNISWLAVVPLIIAKSLYLFGKSDKLKMIAYVVEKSIIILIIIVFVWQELFDRSPYFALHRIRFLWLPNRSIGYIIASWLIFGLQYIKVTKKKLPIYYQGVMGITVLCSLFFMVKDYWATGILMLCISGMLLVREFMKKPIWSSIDCQLLLVAWVLISSYMFDAGEIIGYTGASHEGVKFYGIFSLLILVFATIIQWMSVRSSLSEQVSIESSMS